MTMTNLVFVAALLIGFPVFAGDPAADFVNANENYRNKRFDEALTIYQDLHKRGFDNALIHYNIGNTYLRLGELGKSLAAYRRSERSDPRNEDLIANIEFVGELAKDKVEIGEWPKFMKSFCFWYYRMSLSELAFIVMILNALFWLAALLRYRSDHEGLRWSFYGLLLFILFFGSTLLTKTYNLYYRHQGVVIASEVQVRSGKDGAVLFNLHQAAEVDLLDRDGGWSKIELPDGKKGWLKDELIEIF